MGLVGPCAAMWANWTKTHGNGHSKVHSMNAGMAMAMTMHDVMAVP